MLVGATAALVPRKHCRMIACHTAGGLRWRLDFAPRRVCATLERTRVLVGEGSTAWHGDRTSPYPSWKALDHTPRAFTWHGVAYRVRVIGKWHLQDRWWQATAERGRSNRYYYRVATRDHQVFEPYLDVARRPPLWVLDVLEE